MTVADKPLATMDRDLLTPMRSQSSVLGVTLLFTIVVAGTGVLLLVGGTALTDTQTQANVERATQEMTLFDSRAAMVALGDAESQTVKLSGGDGSYTVDNESGYILVKNQNYSGNDDTEVILNATLGSMTYENGETTVAYQGGGVWRTGDGQDGSTLVSPPEFHYRRATLTLPVIMINNTASASGSIQASVDADGTTERVFPNSSAATDGSGEVGPPYDPAWGTEKSYANPIRNGSVTVMIKSEYYQGWYRYFTQRTSGDPGINNSNQTAWVTLATIEGSIGAFEMPNEGNALDVRGMADGHPISEFQLTLKEDGNWKNAEWSFYVDDTEVDAEFHVQVPGGTNCNSNGGSPDTLNKDLEISLFYRNSSGTTTVHEEWVADDIGPSGYDVDCDERTLTVDFVPASNDLEYQDLNVPGSSGNKYYHSALIDTNDITTTKSFDQSYSGHSQDGSLGPYNTGNTENLGTLTNHYMGLLAPNHDLIVTDGPGGGKGRIAEGGSSGVLTFAEATGTQYLTYLHITKNRVEIDLD